MNVCTKINFKYTKKNKKKPKVSQEACTKNDVKSNCGIIYIYL